MCHFLAKRSRPLALDAYHDFNPNRRSSPVLCFMTVSEDLRSVGEGNCSAEKRYRTLTCTRAAPRPSSATFRVKHPVSVDLPESTFPIIATRSCPLCSSWVLALLVAPSLGTVGGVRRESPVSPDGTGGGIDAIGEANKREPVHYIDDAHMVSNIYCLSKSHCLETLGRASRGWWYPPCPIERSPEYETLLLLSDNERNAAIIRQLNNWTCLKRMTLHP